jgi:ElaB/YqjD/DUF883 family membrane-anchored ribosome-binding protein
MAMSRSAEEAQQVLSELEMQQRIDDLKAEIAAISRTLSAMGGQKAEDFRDHVENLASDAVAASRTAVDGAIAEARSLEESVERHIKDNPMRAIGIAAGVGFLFALLTRR